MQITDQNIIAENIDNQLDIKGPNDCKEILEEFGVSYREEGLYLQVGECPSKGWVLHISSIRVQFTPMLMAVMPVLIDAKVSFKIPKNKYTAKGLVDGTLGYTQLGKLICTYPTDAAQAQVLARSLIKVTDEFRSPSIPTDKFLGGTVFTCYEDQETISYSIPFRLPSGLAWPFEEISPIVKSKNKPLLNYKYRPLRVIKSDVKGSVIQGNYFKSLFNIKMCIIKEGIKNMWADEKGRDIVDRIKWQYELYKELGEHIPTPAIFDLFQEKDNTYLAIEFIRGNSLHVKIDSIYNGNSAHLISIDSRLFILQLFLKILSAIEILHEKGYVHRDITPENFIVTNTGAIFLIDMELTYHIPRQYPSPAFKLGSHGYMSPEQQNCEIPTVKEDIYALGALLFFCLSGLPAVKLDTYTDKNILSNLEFLTGSNNLCPLIKKCLSKNREERPTITFIRQEIESYKTEIQIFSNKKILSPDTAISNSTLTEIINKSLAGLSSSEIMTENKVWTSQKMIDDGAGTRSLDREISIGLHTGVTGILYTIAVAKRQGYTVDPCLPGFNSSWDYILNMHPNLISEIGPGLYYGNAGIAMAMTEGLSSGLLPEVDYNDRLISLFQTISTEHNLARGVAGQGTALLNCKTNLASEFYTPLLSNYIEQLLSAQQKDGSWHIYRNSGRTKDNIIGLAYGTAGILLFLIRYYKYFSEPQILPAIENGMTWLIKQLHNNKNGSFWTISTKSKSDNPFDINLGTRGIVLVFIEGYEVLKDRQYKELTEMVLQATPPQPINMDYTLATGLTGLGYLYLNAWQAFENEEWHERTKWIINLFIHTFLEDKKSRGCWSVGLYPDLEGDLMTGVSGIITFLMKYQCINNEMI
jgi:serine/threonine protein kinase